MESEPSFDAADLADAILGPPPVRAPAPSEPITRETPVVSSLVAPPPPPLRGWTDAQRALFGLAVLAVVIVLIGVAAIGGDRDVEAPCEDPTGLFDDRSC